MKTSCSPRKVVDGPTDGQALELKRELDTLRQQWASALDRHTEKTALEAEAGDGSQDGGADGRCWRSPADCWFGFVSAA